MTLLVTICFALLFPLGTPVLANSDSSPIHADVRESNSKPFWLDRAMFIHEEWLFVVGVATKAHTIEEGRTRSLDAARGELRGIEPKYLEQNVETKDMYEEQALDGTYTVYRLIVVKLRDWSPYFVDKDKAEEVARIIERAEERKRLEAQRLRDADAEREQDTKRAKALGKSHVYLYISQLKFHCGMKDWLAGAYERAQTDKGRERYRSLVLRESKWLFRKPEQGEVEREIDHSISDLKRDKDYSEEACEELQEADILVAKMDLEEKAEKQRLAAARLKWEEEHKRSFLGQTAKITCVVATLGLCGFFIRW
ncbi:MAG: hypothetical protein GDA67_01605 [Nitrospira sp. CR1.3]|nr:hypothetical protein [Nitrospira sp. CR1.3]